MTSAHTHLRNLIQLRERLDSHSARVTAVHAKHFACRQGCSGCCQTERTVNDLEFAALTEGFEALEPATQERLSNNPGSGCPLLLDDTCALYEERPLICRSHGLPIILENRLDVCPLNFEDMSLKELPETDLLSVDTITTILAVSNMLYCQEASGDPERRRPVSALWDDSSKMR